MAVALLVGRYVAPDFTVAPLVQRIVWLAALVGGGVLVYLAAMVLLGFRWRDLREH